MELRENDRMGRGESGGDTADVQGRAGHLEEMADGAPPHGSDEEGRSR